jgi:dTDP-4-amino-4,6-dideoxygalactose transaminase
MFPKAEWIGEHTVSLPLGPGMSDSDVDEVIEGAYRVLRSGDYT